jgi:protein phosphatase PTC7
MRVSVRLLSSQRLQYHLGLSYAAKQSPPFVAPGEPPASGGFASRSPIPDDSKKAKGKLTRWVDAMKLLPAGRGELRPSDSPDGGWDAGLRERVWKWGAGEDFFAVVDGGDAYVREVIPG